MNLQPIELCNLCAGVSYPTLNVDNERAIKSIQAQKNKNTSLELEIWLQEIAGIKFIDMTDSMVCTFCKQKQVEIIRVYHLF